ncbi:MAG: hypothetical protein IPJ82_21060 [Lewinellaceae bacterium]|nr:hypothetical protein [Lewinellaceae bacterium]
MDLLAATVLLQAQNVTNGKGMNDPITGPAFSNGEDCANAVTSAVRFPPYRARTHGGAMGDAGLATSADPNACTTTSRNWPLQKNVSLFPRPAPVDAQPV